MASTKELVLADAKAPPTRPGHWLWGSAQDMHADPLAFYHSVMRDCGDVVRLSAMHLFQWYSVTHPDGVARVLGKNHANYRKPDFFLGAVRPVFGLGLFSTDGADWKRKRRMMMPVFKRQKLYELVPTIVQATDEVLAGWESAASGEPIDARGRVALFWDGVAALLTGLWGSPAGCL